MEALFKGPLSPFFSNLSKSLGPWISEKQMKKSSKGIEMKSVFKGSLKVPIDNNRYRCYTALTFGQPATPG